MRRPTWAPKYDHGQSPPPARLGAGHDQRSRSARRLGAGCDQQFRPATRRRAGCDQQSPVPAAPVRTRRNRGGCRRSRNPLPPWRPRPGPGSAVVQSWALEEPRAAATSRWPAAPAPQRLHWVGAHSCAGQNSAAGRPTFAPKCDHGQSPPAGRPGARRDQQFPPPVRSRRDRGGCRRSRNPLSRWRPRPGRGSAVVSSCALEGHRAAATPSWSAAPAPQPQRLSWVGARSCVGHHSAVRRALPANRGPLTWPPGCLVAAARERSAGSGRRPPDRRPRVHSRFVTPAVNETFTGSDRRHIRACITLRECTRLVDPSRRSVLRSHRRAMSCQNSSTQVVDASRGSVVRSHRRAMSCQNSSTQVVAASRRSVLRSHSKVMHGPCRPPQQVSAYAPPPPLFQTEKQLTARADRRARAPAHAVASTTAVAIGGTGSVHRRTGMLAAPTLPGGEGSRPGSLPATDCPQNPPPALPAIQTHCCSDHRHAWRCNADPDVDLEKKEVRMILKEPHARAA